MSAIKEIVVLCGGYGARLGNMTKNKPKPMIKLIDKPILEHSMQLVKEELNPKKFLLVIGYKGEKIKKHFGNAFSGKKIEYLTQKIPKKKYSAKLKSSQIQAVLAASKKIRGELFWLYAGDYVFSREFLQQVNKTNTKTKTMLLFFKKKGNEKHTIKQDNEKNLTRIGEGIKGDVKGSKVFYCFSKKALNPLKKQEFESFDTFLNKLAKNGKIKVELTEAWAKDIDTPTDLKEAEKWVQKHPAHL